MRETLHDVEVEVAAAGAGSEEAAEGGEEGQLIWLARMAVATGVAGSYFGAADVDRAESGARERSPDRASLLDKVRALFSRARVEDQERTSHVWRWPLFLLSCPAAPGARTEVVLTTQHAQSSRWSLRLLGSGLDGARTMTFSDSHGGTAGPGEHHLLFLEKQVDTVEFALVRDGEVTGRGVRLDVASGPGKVGWAQLEGPPAWATAGERLVQLGYREAGRSALHSWSRDEAYASTYALVLGPKLGPVAVKNTLRYQLKKSVTLRSRLPGGDDWDVMRPAECAGLLVRPAEAEKEP